MCTVVKGGQKSSAKGMSFEPHHRNVVRAPQFLGAHPPNQAKCDEVVAATSAVGRGEVLATRPPGAWKPASTERDSA
jgi:hypothetical protein